MSDEVAAHAEELHAEHHSGYIVPSLDSCPEHTRDEYEHLVRDLRSRISVTTGRIDRCQICGSTDLTVILDMGDQPLAERFGHPKTYPLALQQCGDCTLVQLTYAVDQAEVFPLDHPYTSGSTRALVEHFMILSGRVARYLDDGDLIVDIGCNDGTFLGLIRPWVRKAGVEPTNQILKAAKEISPYQEFFTASLASRLREHHGLAKVITAANVLAHVPDPHDFVQGVVGLLADDGVFVTENHDVASIIDGLQWDTVYHEHQRYYSITSLSRLLGMHGLTVTGVERISTHGGSVRVFARKQRGDLQGRAWRAAMDLHHLLAAISRRGELIYGVGATTRATPLIHYAGIAGFLSCVAEVPGSEKIGYLMPGTDVSVVDEARLIEDQPPYALLLSWHVADSIVKSLRAKGFKGKFIKPLPVPEVLDG